MGNPWAWLGWGSITNKQCAVCSALCELHHASLGVHDMLERLPRAACHVGDNRRQHWLFFSVEGTSGRDQQTWCNRLLAASVTKRVTSPICFPVSLGRLSNYESNRQRIVRSTLHRREAVLLL